MNTTTEDGLTSVKREMVHGSEDRFATKDKNNDDGGVLGEDPEAQLLTAKSTMSEESTMDEKLINGEVKIENRTTYGSTDMSVDLQDHKYLGQNESYNGFDYMNGYDSLVNYTKKNKELSKSKLCFLLAGLSVAIVIAAAIYLPHTQTAGIVDSQINSTTDLDSNTSKPMESIPFQIEYTRVDRSDYSIPANQIIDSTLFHPSLRNDLSCNDDDDNDDNDDDDDDASADSDDGSNCMRKVSSTSSLTSKLTHGQPLLKVPLPTGAFWTNLILPLSDSNANNGLSYPIMVYPYAYEWNLKKLVLSYSSLRRIMDEKSIRDIFNPDITFQSKEVVSSRQITRFDPLSVTLRYNTGQTNAVNSFWETYLVQGSPWTTLKYVHATPIIKALSIFTSVDCLYLSDENVSDDDKSCQVLQDNNPKILKGTKFLIHTEQNLDWLLVTSDTVVLSFGTIRKTTITTTEPFNGIFRLAVIPPKQTNDFPLSNSFSRNFESIDIQSSTGVQKLMQSHDIYATGVHVKWDFEPSSSQITSTVAKLTFEYQTQSMSNTDLNNLNCQDTNLLMMSLPHHTQVITTEGATMLNSTTFDISYRTIKGYMTPVVGGCWIMEEPLTDTVIDSQTTLDKVSKLNNDLRKGIFQQIKADSTISLPNKKEGVYGYGKEIARLAQLAHIANTLGKDYPDDDDFVKTLLDDLTSSLHSFVVDFLTGNIKDELLYDQNFGGIISTVGLKNVEADFGNGWYNDHHFHYGYIMYACGILGKLNSTFAYEYGTHVDSIMYDVVNHKNVHSSDIDEDHFYPFVRMKSWFDGHSYASGLFPMADGKSQESSTESINCYYGAYLWSSVRNQQDDNITNFARLLLATEMRSVRLYWHMHQDGKARDVLNNPSLYNPIFAKNMMVGNSAMTDVTVTTWFGNQPLFVHMINFMPVTGISREIFDQEYIVEEFDTVIKPIYNNVEMGWSGYVVCDRAFGEPMEAWKDALRLRSSLLDTGISKSQILYFISSMNDFDPEIATVPGDNSVTNGSDTASCAKNPTCAELGLMGLCCPTPSGTVLGCCNVFA